MQLLVGSCVCVFFWLGVALLPTELELVVLEGVCEALLLPPVTFPPLWLTGAFEPVSFCLACACDTACCSVSVHCTEP